LGNEVLYYGLGDTFLLIQPKAFSLSSQILLKIKKVFEKVSKRSRKLEGDSKLPEPLVSCVFHFGLTQNETKGQGP